MFLYAVSVSVIVFAFSVCAYTTIIASIHTEVNYNKFNEINGLTKKIEKYYLFINTV